MSKSWLGFVGLSCMVGALSCSSAGRNETSGRVASNLFTPPGNGFTQCDVAALPGGTPLADTGILGIATLPDGTVRTGMNGGGLWSYTSPSSCPASPLTMTNLDPTSANTAPPNGPVLDLLVNLQNQLFATRAYSQVARINPANGATIGSPIPSPNTGGLGALGLALDPVTGDLFFSSRLGATSIVYRIPASCNPSIPATCPVTQFGTTTVTSELDGIAWSCDGQRLLGASEETSIVGWTRAGGSGTLFSTTLSNGFGNGSDGLAFGMPGTGLGNFVYTNNNDGSVSEICVKAGIPEPSLCPVAQAPSTRSPIVSGSGLRGDFMKVDPKGNLLLSQLDRVTMVSPPRGGLEGGEFIVPGSSSCANFQCALASHPACAAQAGISSLANACDPHIADSFCSTSAACAPVLEAARSLQTAADRIFGFERAADFTLAPWSAPATLSVQTARRTQACEGLQIRGKGFMELSTAQFSSQDLIGPSSRIDVDLFIPTGQPNPSWLGALQMYLSCPAEGINHSYIGQVELTGKPVGAFSTLAFDLSASQLQPLQAGTATDCSFNFALNVNSTGPTLSWVLDNLRFGTPGVPPTACSGRGTLDTTSGTCLCDLGATGPVCATCAAGFTLRNGRCALNNDTCTGATASTWPNRCSNKNSDPWLAVHHDDIQLMKPTVLVLLYANPGTLAAETSLVDTIANGFAQGSRALGTGPVQLQYNLRVVDLRDGVGGRPPPPASYPFQNSTLYPRVGPPLPGAPGGTFDYTTLFSPAYAANYGFAGNPDLCTLVNQGTIHEVWVVVSDDVPDTTGLLEVMSERPNYTASDNQTGTVNTCANGCAPPTVPFCGRSLRVGQVNYTRGPGCFLHSQGHDIEFGLQNSVPSFQEWFSPFARFNLSSPPPVGYSLPFSNLYGVSSFSLLSQTHAQFPFGGTTFDVDPFDPVCGDVHYAPNGVSQYDYFDADTVLSSCDEFGRSNIKLPISGTPPTALPWNTATNAQYGDCGGEFMVWWYQHMPSHGSGQFFSTPPPPAAPRLMKSIWPYMFY
ncbi:MAG TPA: hypothetical protein VGI10_26555 [Polyangiaceae bacterium]|jgi:hypothetical protein